MSQSPLLEFRSSAFRDEAGVDEATNRGIFGKALAGWVSKMLEGAGISTDEIFAEDFAWCVGCEVLSCRAYVACAGGNQDPFDWQVLVFADDGLLSRPLFRKDRRSEAIESLFATVRKILRAAPEVTDLREERAQP